MEKIPHKYQQCLVFIFKSAAIQRPVTRHWTAPPHLEAFILVPQGFLWERPDLEDLFLPNNIRVVDEENVQRLIDNAEGFHTVEIFLETDHAASVNPLYVAGPRLERYFLERLFSSTAVLPLEPSQYCLHSRSAVDDTNISAFRLLYENSTALRNIHVMKSIWWPPVICCFPRLASYRDPWTLSSTLGAHRRLNVFDAHHNLSTSTEVPASIMIELVMGRPDHLDKLLTFLVIGNDHLELTEILLQNLQNEAELNRSLEHFPQLRDLFPPGQTLLHEAVTFRKYGAIRAMLNYGAQPDVRTVNFHSMNESFLEFACVYNIDPSAFKYILERCFTNFDLLKSNLNLTKFPSIVQVNPPPGLRRNSQDLYDVIARHTFKIAVLEDRLSDEICRHLPDEGILRFPLDVEVFVRECKAEVAQMANQTLVDTEVAILELLAKTEHEVAPLLRRKGVAQIAESDELTTQFPIYGGILKVQLEKGHLRKFIQVEGTKALNTLSPHFRILPDELKDVIVGYLGMFEAVRLKKVSDRRRSHFQECACSWHRIYATI